MKMMSSLLISGIVFIISFSADALNAEDIYKKVNKSVYTLYTVNFYDKSPESLGSAIAVTDHVLATNCHVALTGNYLGIILDDKFKLGTIFFRDVNRDICFVEVPGVVFTPVKIRNSENVKVGEQVYAVGNPEGLEKSISQGIISNKRKDKGGYVLQTDATVSFGSSGGGLFDQNAKLVGITNSVDRYSKHIAFAIPTEWITQILFPKENEEGQNAGKVITTQKNNNAPEKKLKKMGNFGKDNITLFSTTQKCFILFTGKNEYGEVAGSAIWYPEKPSIIIIFPNSTDINKNFQIMNTIFYSHQTESPTYSNDFLYFDNKKYKLIGIRAENGRFPLLITKLPITSPDKFLQIPSFDVTYEDGNTVQGFKKVTYGLDGFKDAIATYHQQCKVAPIR
jgi:serine protease Do